MKKIVKHSVLFCSPFFIGVLVLYFANVDKKFSYQFVQGECDNRASFFYNRIFENNKPIDVAFSGASHIACGIMDELIEKELSDIAGKPIHVSNLGYCRGGRDLQYIFLKDLFEHKNPKILFVIVAEDEAKKGHPVFPYLASSKDLFTSFVFLNQRFPGNLWKGLSVRFEHLKFKIFKREHAKYNYSDFGYIPGPFQATSSELEANLKAWQRRLSHQNPEFIRNIETRYSKHYLSKIVNLAKSKHCVVNFIYLPESGSGLTKPLHENFYNTLTETVCLPDSIISNPNNWKDASHFNDTGAKQASQYLVKLLSESF